jgi:hypothetical protein
MGMGVTKKPLDDAPGNVHQDGCRGEGEGGNYPRSIPRGDQWPFCGAIVPGYPTLHPLQPDFWPKFWKLYLAGCAPDAGRIKRPSLYPA